MKRGYIYSIIFLMCIVSTTIAQDTKPQWIESIRVLSPLSCSEVSGRVKVRLQAKGLTHLQAQCFVPNRKNPYAKPQKLVLTPKGIKLNNEGIGTFTINTRALPHGPLTVQIIGEGPKGERDLYELQLYNSTGDQRRTAAGIPDTIPAAARGMQLA